MADTVIPKEVECEHGLVFFGNEICPFAQRVWWALKEKNIPFSYVHIPLGPEKPLWYAQKVNPRATVPTIRHDGKLVLESLIQAEFVEDAFPQSGPHLLPKDPHERAAVRLFLDVVGQVTPLLYRFLTQTDAKVLEEAKKELTIKVQALGDLIEAQSKDQQGESGPFFLGQRLSLAEIALVPHFYRFVALLEQFWAFKLVDVDQRVTKLYEAAIQRQAFKETAPDLNTFIPAIVARFKLQPLR